MNTRDITLSVNKGFMPNSPVIIGQGDKNGVTIRATIYDNGQLASLSGMTAKFMLRSGTSYFEDASCTVSGSTITYAMDEEHAASVAGMAQAYFAIYQGTTHVYSTSRFDVKVLRAASSGADPAQSYSDDIVAATQAARAAADAAEEAMEDIGTAVSDAQQAAASASQAVSDAQQAVSDADTAKQTATSAANAATTAAASANAAASSANAAAAATNEAISTANDAAARAEDAIDAMGDISEIAVPLMSSDVRGGAKLGEGLAITDGALGIDPAPQQSTGEVRGSIAALTAKGHAEQATTTGKNLCDTSTITNGTKYNTTMVRNADGSVTISTGTNTTGAQLHYDCATTLLPAGTYTLSGCPQGGSTSTYMTYIPDLAYDTGAGSSFTIESETEVIPRILLRTGVTFNATFYPQLEAGSEATDYEPYTNGPSPSPDWPQEIQVTRGRNLLDESILLGATGWQQEPDGSYYGSNTAMHNYTYNQDVFGITFEPNTQYTMRVHTRNVTAGKKLYFNFVYTDGTYTTTSVTDNNSTEWFDLALVSSLGKSVQSFYISYNSNGVCYIVDLQLTLGSTPTPYVPYGYVGLEVQGKNLLPNIPSSFTNGATFVSFGKPVDFDGMYLSFYFSGSFTHGGAAFMALVREDGTTAAITMGYMRLASDNTAPVAGTTYSHEKMTFTSSAQARYVEVRLYTNPAFTNPKFEECVLNNSTTPMDYEPYYHETRAIPLPSRGWVAGLSDGTADVLTLDGAGKVEWGLNDAEVVLDGTQAPLVTNWRPNETSVGWGYSKSVIPSKTGTAGAAGGTDNLMSDKLRAVLYASSIGEEIFSDSGNMISLSYDANYGLFCRVEDTSLTTANAVNAWLAENPITVLYPLATPVTEDCGYVDDWPTDIPDGAVITIPELDAVGVTYLIGDSVAKMARQWYARARSEYEDRITNLESAVAQLIAEG